MSRCIGCNDPLLNSYRLINKHTGQEEDMCLTCRRASQYAYVYPEYTQGTAKEGLTIPPKENYDNNS